MAKPPAKPAMKAAITGPLTTVTARALTDEVKRDSEALWRKIGRLHDENAHGLLGYSSWVAYLEAEFGITKSRGYRLLAQSQVVAAIEAESPIGDKSPVELPNEAQTRILARGHDTDVAVEAWREVTADGKRPTVETVREAVNSRLPDSIKPLPKQLCLPEDKLRAVAAGDADAILWLRERLAR